MRNKFFFSEDGLTFIDMSRISGISKAFNSSAFHVILRENDGVLTVVGDTVTELFEAMHEYSLGE